MLDFPTWRKAWLWLVTAAAALAALPSLFALANVPWPSALPEPMVNLGLDLAGGSHILLEAESGQIAAQRLENMEETVRTRMRLASPRIRIGEVEFELFKQCARCVLTTVDLQNAEKSPAAP